MTARVSAMPARVAPPPKRAELFYQSAQWRDLVRDIKRMRGAWCERCGSNNRIIADHIVERKDGGVDLDPANIRLLCGKCHAAKTARARAARAAGQVLDERGVAATARGEGKSSQG